MPIVVSLLALAAFAWAFYASPAFRPWGLGLAAAISLALGGWLLLTEGRSKPQPEIAASELTLDQLDLQRVGRGATLTGRVLNGSAAYRLRDMTIVLRLHDCPAADTPPATCPVLGEATATARPDAPAGQIRAFSALFAFPNLAPAAGTLRWDWEITGTRATD